MAKEKSILKYLHQKQIFSQKTQMEMDIGSTADISFYNVLKYLCKCSDIFLCVRL